MLAFGWLFNIVERGRASYDRVAALTSRKVRYYHDRSHALEVVPSGDIQYDIEKFTFPGENEPMFKGISILRLNRGETLGIVGKTGAGKTTLLKLLIREFEGL